MLITREQVIKRLSKATGFYKKDVRRLFLMLDDLIEELLAKATDDEEVSVQLIRGLKITNKIVGERERIDPRTREPIICKPTAKVWAKISETLKENLQKAYDESGGE